MKKIAIVTSGYLPVPASKGGGVEVLDEYLIKENEDNNYANLTVFSSDDAKARERAKNYRNTNVIFVTTPRLVRYFDKVIFKIANNILKKSNSNSFRYILQRLYYINFVSKKLAKKKYDSLILENHATLFSVLRKHGNYERYFKNYYYHLHNEVKSSYGNDKYIKNVNKVLGVSNYINSTLKSKYPQMSDDQFTVIRNAVDSERFELSLSSVEKKKIRRELGIPKDNFVFLYTGRLNEEKGILEAVEAFGKANLKDATFLIVGSTFFDTDIKSDFEIKLGKAISIVGDSIKFTGYIPNERLGRIYAIADVCVIPSIWEDPAPLTVIEAITAGKAVITTNSGGIPEYVNGKNAIILDKNKDLGLKFTNNLCFIYKNYEVLKRMEQESRKLRKTMSIKLFARSFFNKID